MSSIQLRGIQTRNLPQYRALHKRRRYGTTADARLQWVLPHVKKLAPASILDYGCGTSHLGDLLAKEVGAESYRFDPGIPAHAEMPAEAAEGVDLVICCHVLEHVDPEEVDLILEQLALLSPNVYLEIPTASAKTILPNGENAHSIVKGESWWLEKFQEHFPNAVKVPTRWDDNLGVATFEPAEGVAPEGTSPSGRKRRSRRLPGRSRRKSPLPRAHFTPRPVKSPKIAGQSVAIVARAKSILGSGEGEVIDSHDVVVRVNAKLPLDSKAAADLGARTDLVYACQSAKSARTAAQKLGVATCYHNKGVRKKLSTSDGYTPFTGTVAVFEMIHLGAKEVYVTGMDLYSGPPLGNTGGQLKMSIKSGFKFHDPSRDLQLLKDLLVEKPEIFKPSPQLREILSQDTVTHFKGKKVPV